MTVIQLIIMALAPIATIVAYIYFKDKYEKEPTRLLIISFLLGAIVSVIITTIFYIFFNNFLPLEDKLSVWEQFKQAFFVVGFSEELSKYLIVLLFAQRHKEFNEPFDGIVYAVMVSMGFAATENIMYVLQHGASTALLRAFTAVPAHATFGILMGYFMGMAKFKPNKLFLNLCGLLLAIVFHGAYDFFLFINFIPGIWVGAFVSLALGLFLSRKAIKRHQKGSFFKN
ncbi:RsiW-degrading membrane proteinase PrsW (M82 family) [Mesoflavibacter sabulilitoris]|uniref:PrsW family intramembrane metalloprotease n=1 Tax=Mesoflavibacter TaxID=444051 RepID=UPI0017D5991C|nr:PrsW family glutamic-type intramembrane protease [Mesoflavibacter zeaxanthinifaciens]MBB3124911.1 RsiW-degrading membrane proteinase PrsW (M82 family) [Mesoflavibacter zeaxanthinifaciens subsp. sabulilitoris]